MQEVSKSSFNRNNYMVTGHRYSDNVTLEHSQLLRGLQCYAIAQSWGMGVDETSFLGKAKA
ncbi:hypothetical protein INR49_018425 [Caranx melampygus]|nr:hypothetical protein INR49_018425 [Caranx melampygus]